LNKVYVVGIGPGHYEGMTIEAAGTLEKCDVIIGYGVYVDLVKEYFQNKEYVTTPMKREAERCRIALDMAKEGKVVSMVCSGDAGVYGMAGLMCKMAKDSGVEVEVISGVSAAMSGAALLGAPLMHDFSVISLSDLLTPWEKIENRLRLASQADFVICIYNPSSKKRADYLMRACDIMMEYKSPDTVCGIVKNIGRDGEEMRILTLLELRDTKVDMFSTVFIGNSETLVIDGKMVTPRGYVYE